MKLPKQSFHHGVRGVDAQLGQAAHLLVSDLDGLLLHLLFLFLSYLFLTALEQVVLQWLFLRFFFKE